MLKLSPAADDVEVIVNEPGQGAASLEVDDPGGRAGARHDFLVMTDRNKPAVLDRDGVGGRV
jgi:hypothetical protein